MLVLLWQVGVIGNLVHSSVNTKKEVLAAGALQPVIGLLSSRCQESQREAALLLGQFATTDPECKVNIVQCGAVRPLISMLEAPDPQLREMAAFALGHQAPVLITAALISALAEDSHNAAFALYGLADNEDNVSDIVREGGVQRLFKGELIVQASKDCVQKTLKRLEEKIHGWVLKHLLYLMRPRTRLSREGLPTLLRTWMEVLLEMLTSFTNLKQQHDGTHALPTLAKKATAVSPIDVVPLPPTPQAYLGEQYVNSSKLSDVTFLVEGDSLCSNGNCMLAGRQFFAHRIAFLASSVSWQLRPKRRISDAFCAMFDGGYRVSRRGYCHIVQGRGAVEVTTDVAQDLLRAADQYLLEGLKTVMRVCYSPGQFHESYLTRSSNLIKGQEDLTVENVANVYELAEAYHALSLRHTYVLFNLKQHEQMSILTGYPALTQQIVPEIHDYLHTIFQPQPLISPEQLLWSILERGSDTFFSHFAFCAPGDGVPQNSWKCCGNHLSLVHLPHLTLSDEKFNYPKRTCQIE
ncbi:unnamed protein product [Sphagnum troendelagicum]